MSNRFHNKWHRVSHHTYKDPNIIDAGWDPIASHENPFKGDFVIDGSIEGSLFSKDLYAIHLYPGNDMVDWHTDTITAYSNFVVTGNETVGGNTSGHGWIKTDSYLHALGADNEGYGLVVNKKARVDGETVLNDKTYVTKNGLFVTGDSEFKDDLTIDQQITVKGTNNNYISGSVRVGKSISAHDYIKTDTDVSARDIYATNNVYVGNDLDVNNTLTAYDIVVKHHLSAVSATIHHVDITASEGRGFVVTGYAPGEEIPSDYFEIPAQPVVGGVKNIYLDKVGLYVDGWAMFKGETEFEHQLILQTDGKVDVGSSFSGGVKTTVYRTDTIVNYPSGGGEYEFHYPNESGILALIENIAPDFDAQATYAIGQLVAYNRKLYRCIAPHSGPWNGAHFEETTVEFSMPWAIGAGDDSVVQKQSTADPIVGLTVGNQAISQSSISEGMGSFSGLKGYRYTNTGAVTNSLTFAVVPEGWAAGDVMSIVNDSKYADCATIASISGTTVTFTENLPFSSIVADTGWDAKTAWVSAKPSIGNVDLGYGAHVEGVGSKALNAAAHAEGRQTLAIGQYSHTEGRETMAQYCAHAEGRRTVATGDDSHAEGGVFRNTTTGTDTRTIASGTRSHAEGEGSLASGVAAHSEGRLARATADVSHAEGNKTEAAGNNSHAEGYETVASGAASHSEGVSTIAGIETTAKSASSDTADGKFTHAEGNGTLAHGNSSHAEGKSSISNGRNSHAEGANTKTDGVASHAEGYQTRTSNRNEHAEGSFNKSNKASNEYGNAGNTLSSVGFGDAESNRKNAVEVMQDGKVYINGVGNYDGTNPGGNSDLAAVISRKAPLNSPAFTGTPTAPTPTSGDNSTKVATTEFVSTAVSTHNTASDAHAALFATRPTMISIGDGVWVFVNGGEGFVVINGEVTTLSESKTSFEDEEYWGVQNLTFVYAPSVVTIGAAFGYCDSLASVSLPSATRIGSDAFYYCGSLVSVSLPAATSIGLGAFYECSSLDSISLPATTSIEDVAFYKCDSLASVSLPSATRIGDNAFFNCASLTTLDLSSFTMAQVEENAATWGIAPPSGKTVTITCSDGEYIIEE